MKTRIALSAVVLLLCAAPLAAQQPQQPHHDPMGEHLFPPELIMQHQKALGLTEEQKNAFKSEMQNAQSGFTNFQWQLQTEIEIMAFLLKQEKVDEQRVMDQLDKILDIERKIKKTQFTLIVRIKNGLTEKQRQQLHEIKGKIIERGKQ